MPQTGAKPRYRSIRSYRRILDEALHRARNGDISTADAKRIGDVAKMGAELLLGENIMKARQIMDLEPDRQHEGLLDGQDGGLEDYRPGAKPKQHVKRRVTVRKGIDKTGAPVEDVQVMLEGGEEVGEYDAEVETDERLLELSPSLPAENEPHGDIDEDVVI